jgi:hypothetical protein
MLDKLFGKAKKKESEPELQFGRYSDNNKAVAKVNRWTDADNAFKDKKYPDSLDAFFDYLRDDGAQNVVYERNGAEGRFQFYQGSRIIRGNFNQEILEAEVTLAKMPQPSVPVMRRLLEMNFNLYYSRFSLDNERLCMRFDSDTETASPGKLYYGLKELATKADKQDDLLVNDFSTLEITDNDHIIAIPESEKEVKYNFMQQWIQQMLDASSGLDADKFSGGIAYMLLALVYRVDYLVSPEGKLLNDLEKISAIYFKKDERPVAEKNRDMIEAFRKLKTVSREEIFQQLFRSRYTFAITSPQVYKTIADSIHGANYNLGWYRDNNYPQIATQIAEYGIAYCQYSYSLPKPITDLYHLFMMINYPDFFTALGYRALYDVKTKTFEKEDILSRIKAIQDAWKEKYPNMEVKTQNLRFDNMVNFDLSYTNEMELLNMEQK